MRECAFTGELGVVVVHFLACVTIVRTGYSGSPALMAHVFRAGKAMLSVALTSIVSRRVTFRCRSGPTPEANGAEIYRLWRLFCI
jgi:hypothetical protein